MICEEHLCEKHRDELVTAIKKIHKMYYSGEFLESPKKAMEFHREFAPLFNFAGITETLVENNPDGLTEKEFLAITTKGCEA